MSYQQKKSSTHGRMWRKRRWRARVGTVAVLAAGMISMPGTAIAETEATNDVQQSVQPQENLVAKRDISIGGSLQYSWVKRTIHYLYDDGTKAADSVTDTVSFTRSVKLANGVIIYDSGWNPDDDDTTFDAVTSPVIPGYSADIPVVEELTGVTRSSRWIEITVTYKENVKPPVELEEEPVPGLPGLPQPSEEMPDPEPAPVPESEPSLVPKDIPVKGDLEKLAQISTDPIITSPGAAEKSPAGKVSILPKTGDVSDKKMAAGGVIVLGVVSFGLAAQFKRKKS